MTKYFQFLDNIDGANNESLDSAKLETRFESLVITDNGNQTFKFVGQLQGPGDSTTAGLEGDKVKFTVDGNAVHSSGDIAIGALSGKTYPATSAEPTGAGKGTIINNAQDKVLAAGDHTLVCTLFNEAGNTATTTTIKRKFKIARSVISMSANAGFVTAVPATGQVNLDLREITLGAGVSNKRPGTTVDYQPGAANGIAHSYTLTATKQEGADAAAAAEAASEAVTLKAGQEAGPEGHNNNATNNIIDAGSVPNAGVHVIYTFTLTPRLADNATALTDDTLTATLSFARDE